MATTTTTTTTRTITQHCKKNIFKINNLKLVLFQKKS